MSDRKNEQIKRGTTNFSHYGSRDTKKVDDSNLETKKSTKEKRGSDSH